LKSLARPLEDTPNSVLRRVANLDEESHRFRNEDAGAKRHVRNAGSETQEDLLEKFLSELRGRARDNGLQVRIWEGGHRRSRNALELAGPDGSSLLYIKTPSESGGFWGLRTTFLRSFDESGLRWHIVLLIGPGEKGYLLSADDVHEAERAGRWSTSVNRLDYKLHEGPELRGAEDFNTYSELADALVR
jgi:hypothetical protein